MLILHSLLFQIYCALFDISSHKILALEKGKIQSHTGWENEVFSVHFLSIQAFKSALRHWPTPFLLLVDKHKILIIPRNTALLYEPPFSFCMSSALPQCPFENVQKWRGEREKEHGGGGLGGWIWQAVPAMRPMTDTFTVEQDKYVNVWER